MKVLILLCALMSSVVMAAEVRIIDSRGLLTSINAELKSKALNEFNKGDEAQILTGGKLVPLKVKKANDRKVVMKGAKKFTLTAEEFEKSNNNMMIKVLRDSKSKVEVNGQVYENTYLIRSVKQVVHTLDNGEKVDAYAIRVTSPDTHMEGMGFAPALTIDFVISTETPAIAQLLKMTMNEQEFFNLRSYSLK